MPATAESNHLRLYGTRQARILDHKTISGRQNKAHEIRRRRFRDFMTGDELLIIINSLIFSRLDLVLQEVDANGAAIIVLRNEGVYGKINTPGSNLKTPGTKLDIEFLSKDVHCSYLLEK